MKINTYSLVRKVHLYAAFCMLGFLFMYFATGFILLHEEWFPDVKSQTTVEQHAVTIPASMDAKMISVFLQKQFNINALRYNPVSNDDGSITFNYEKPGRFYTIKLLPDRMHVEMNDSDFTSTRTITGFHTLHGYGGSRPFLIYMFWMDLASIATLLFGLSGLYLWYRLMRNKLWGILILMLSAGYTIAVIVILMKG
ncbi:MAG: PepSY-associated TM helix domain-containing protein [Bacteroidetes bacterium]|nr:PepSY-associated TM helix domain-containing protein [Bacteroidota bacterium]